jgi:hypothetical protein
MGDFTYTTVPGKIKPILDKIRHVGIPPKVNASWLKTLGLKSSNDATLIGVLKAVGFIDASGIPTSVWSTYRGAHHKQALGEAIRKGYAELFAVYPDAWQRSNTELEHVFSTSSAAGKQVITKTVATFKALCESAEFAPIDEQSEPLVQTGPMHVPAATAAAVPARIANSGTSGGPSVHIDIQIHISPEASIDQIDQIFKSMAKHLYGERKSE